MGKYQDIINLERPKSNRPKMSIKKRAFQFASFDALTGLKSNIAQKIELNSYERDSERLTVTLTELMSRAADRPKVKIICQRQGEQRKIIEGRVKAVLPREQKLVLTDGTLIDFEDLIELLPQ